MYGLDGRLRARRSLAKPLGQIGNFVRLLVLLMFGKSSGIIPKYGLHRAPRSFRFLLW